MKIDSAEIERVVLIDDNPSVRKQYSYSVVDLQLEPIQIDKSFRSVEELISFANFSNAGVICDYHLMSTTYSPFNGDEIVTDFYHRQKPSLLCSRAEEAAYAVRRLRQFIPNVISPSDLSPERVVECFEVCIQEFRGKFLPQRKPYQTLVRIENKEDFKEGAMKVSVVIPGWDSQKMIDIVVQQGDTTIFSEMKRTLDAGDDFRAYATVNLGSESSDEIYIYNWKSL